MRRNVAPAIPPTIAPYFLPFPPPLADEEASEAEEEEGEEAVEFEEGGGVGLAVFCVVDMAGKERERVVV